MPLGSFVKYQEDTPRTYFFDLTSFIALLNAVVAIGRYTHQKGFTFDRCLEYFGTLQFPDWKLEIVAMGRTEYVDIPVLRITVFYTYKAE